MEVMEKIIGGQGRGDCRSHSLRDILVFGDCLAASVGILRSVSILLPIVTSW